MSTHTLRGRDGEVIVNGKTWKTGRMTLNVIDAFLDWCRPLLPDPLTIATNDVLRLERAVRDVQASDAPDADKAAVVATLRRQQEQVTELAFDRATAYLSWTAPEVQGVLRSPRGAARMLYLLLREHQPDVTEDDAWSVLTALGEKQRDVFTKASGKVAGDSTPDPTRPAGGRPRSRGGKSTKR